MLPLSFVQGKGFRALMQMVEPAYPIPSRRSITRRMDIHYEESKQRLLMKLATADKVAITTDCWTALTAESYMTITCHFIGKDDWQVTATQQTS